MRTVTLGNLRVAKAHAGLLKIFILLFIKIYTLIKKNEFKLLLHVCSSNLHGIPCTVAMAVIYLKGNLRDNPAALHCCVLDYGRAIRNLVMQMHAMLVLSIAV